VTSAPPRRVLFVEASSGGVVGGSLTGLYHLIRGLDRTRFSPAMVLYEPKSIEADLKALDVPVYHLRRYRMAKEHALLNYDGYHQAKQSREVRSLLRLGRQTLRLAVEELPAAVRLARLIRKSRADVVHLGNGMRANFDALLACRLTRTPVVCHVKGFEKYARRERCAARHVDAMVSMTHAVQDHCAAHGVVARCNQVIYDAVDENEFQPRRSAEDVRAEFGLSVATPCFGIVGNIQEWKGQAVVVEATAHVHTRVPQAVCLIVGGAHRAGAEYERALHRRVQELGLASAIRFVGFRTDVPDLMNALDVIVHASIRGEPFGRVILEGMLLRKSVIAAAAGGVPELIRDGETGYLVAPGDSAVLADRLVSLLGDPQLRADIGARAQAWAREQFSLAQHVSMMTKLYERLTRHPSD